MTAADRTGGAVAGLRSGQVAAAAGVNVETLRYYERCGLLPAPGRSRGDHRLYDEGSVTTLRVIKAAQRLASPWTRSPSPWRWAGTATGPAAATPDCRLGRRPDR